MMPIVMHSSANPLPHLEQNNFQKGSISSKTNHQNVSLQLQLLLRLLRLLLLLQLQPLNCLLGVETKISSLRQSYDNTI
ncbi:hypothetical protein VTN00DRAFT_264 [Thermoascus crustaceus]|uniref:uncharacterized protein n=1 Tax=Thermoascus crustaceus TaxID=5088 RepID=UPI003742F00E